MIFFLPLLLLLHLFLLRSTLFTLWPEMIVYPYLQNHGFLLYRDLINPYPPLIPHLLSVFAQHFGYEPHPYKYLTSAIILLVDISIFIVAKKLFVNVKYALFSVTFFVIFSSAFGVNGLWFDLIQTPLILFSVYFFSIFLKSLKQKHLVLAFSLLTVAFFIKQQILPLIAFFTLIALYKAQKQFLKTLQFLIAPALIIFALELVIFTIQKTNNDFIFWTITFPFLKASQMPGYVSLPSLKQQLTVISLFALFLPLILKGKVQEKFITSFAAITLLFSYPRFDYFHLVPTLGILSVAVGPNVSHFLKINNKLKIITSVLSILVFVFAFKHYKNNWTHAVRFFDMDIYEASSFLQKSEPKSSPVYIQNGPDQILPLSGRLPIKPWADEFSWYLEAPGLQDRIVNSLREESPSYILFKPYEQGEKYEIGAYIPQKIRSYIDDNYHNYLQVTDDYWLKVKK